MDYTGLMGGVRNTTENFLTTQGGLYVVRLLTVPPNTISWQEWELFAGVRSWDWCGAQSRRSVLEKSEFELARKVAPAGPVFAKLVDERRTESELVGLFGEQREQARRKAFERNC